MSSELSSGINKPTNYGGQEEGPRIVQVSSGPGRYKRTKGMIRSISVWACPLCGEAIDTAVLTDSLDRSSPFWGEPGKRFLVCRAGSHFHIQIETLEGISQRYAYVSPYSWPKAKESNHGAL